MRLIKIISTKQLLLDQLSNLYIFSVSDVIGGGQVFELSKCSYQKTFYNEFCHKIIDVITFSVLLRTWFITKPFQLIVTMQLIFHPCLDLPSILFSWISSSHT